MRVSFRQSVPEFDSRIYKFFETKVVDQVVVRSAEHRLSACEGEVGLSVVELRDAVDVCGLLQSRTVHHQKHSVAGYLQVRLIEVGSLEVRRSVRRSRMFGEVTARASMSYDHGSAWV